MGLSPLKPKQGGFSPWGTLSPAKAPILTPKSLLLLLTFAATPLHAQGKVLQETPTTPSAPADTLPQTPITDADRLAIHIDALTLDLHLTPADSLEETHATLTLRNTTDHPLTRIPLQISSTLHWQSLSQPFTQSPIATDTDHTGYAQEAVLTPRSPLAPGQALTVTAFYTGKIPPSAARLTVLGAAPEAAAQSDWDAILPTTDSGATALRGFGNVLWYPVAAPAAILGETDKLFAAVAAQRFANQTTLFELRLTVLYTGDPPNAAVLSGALQPLANQPDDEDTLIGETRGIATALYPARPIGFRIPSLFLTAQPAVTGQFLSVVTPNPPSADPYRAAAELLAPLLTETLGPLPAAPLLLLDHPGQPYEDHALLAAQLAPEVDPQAVAPALLRPLTHAWFAVPGAQNNWLDQGLPELLSLLYLERTQGREAALAELRQASVLIALAEPDFTAAPDLPGQPLTSAASEVYLHRKAAAVLWQLRDLVGEAEFRDALVAFRRACTVNPKLAQDPDAFEKTLERVSGKDLAWFFPDWVYRDRGLPDLTIVQVNPRPVAGLQLAHPERGAGYLVAVEVRNDGDAPAEVPVTVSAAKGSTALGGHADTLTATERLRIPPHTSRSTRILFESTPELVQVNDGTVPELRTTTHTYKIQQVTPTP